jgi:hypothetical protein
MWAKSTTDTAEPRRAVDLTENAEPSDMESRTETDPLRSTVSYIESVEPSVMNARVERVEPQSAVLNTDIDEPNLRKPRSESVEARLRKSKIDVRSVSSRICFPVAKMLKFEPSLAPARTLSELPKFKKSMRDA